MNNNNQDVPVENHEEDYGISNEEYSGNYLEYNKIDLSNYKFSNLSFTEFSDKVNSSPITFNRLIIFNIFESGLKKIGREI